MKEQLASATPAELLVVLAKENAARRKNRFWIPAIFGGGVLILLILNLIQWIARGEPMEFESYLPMLALLGIGAAFTTTHKDALKRISEIANRESAGYLLEAYATADERDVKEVCRTALPSALAQVTEADDLDNYQRGLLNKLLSVREPQEIAGEALNCVGRIAGPESIKALEDFQASASKHKDASWERLGSQALMVLPDIRIRTARQIIDRKLSESQVSSEEEAVRLQQSV